jgi:hypothetical protein
VTTPLKSPKVTKPPTPPKVTEPPTAPKVTTPPKPPKVIEPPKPPKVTTPPKPPRQGGDDAVKARDPKGPKGGEKKSAVAKTEKEQIETGVEPQSAKDKGKRKTETAKKQRTKEEVDPEDQQYAEQERADKAKGKAKGKQQAEVRSGEQQKAAPPGADPAFRQHVDDTVKRDLNQTGRYDGLEKWTLKDLDGPHPMAEQDPMLGTGRGSRYYATYQKADGSTITVSVNYDPLANHFGTIKESSGKK